MMNNSDLSIVILCAGNGTRMRSKKPKVLHTLAGKTLIERVVETASLLEPKKIILVHNPEHQTQLEDLLQSYPITWVAQTERRGTGHAVLQALPYIETNQSLVLYGDVPLLPQKLLTTLQEHTATQFGMITAQTPTPHGFGRIIRDEKHNIIRIVEEKDADASTKLIEEINTGIMLFPTQFLQESLPKLEPKNAQGEYYLTDCVALWQEKSIPVKSVSATCFWHIQGVNTQAELVHLERTWMRYQAEKLLEQGVRITDPERFDIHGNLICENDISISPNVYIKDHCEIGENSSIGNNCSLNRVKIGKNVVIGNFCELENVHIEDNAKIDSFSKLENTLVGQHAKVGPYAYVRPGTKIGNHAKLGAFVEAKNSELEYGSKVAHLSYVGDCKIGENSNIGAGFVHANYHGPHREKSTSSIGKNAFIGANCTIVSPITIGEDSTVGAGTTVRKNVADNAMHVTLGKEVTKENWQEQEQPSLSNNEENSSLQTL